MKRTLLTIILSSAILLLLLLLFLPQPPLKIHNTSLAAVDSGQEQFAHQLELGIRFWQRGEVDLAQQAFIEAAHARQASIGMDARNNLFELWSARQPRNWFWQLKLSLGEMIGRVPLLIAYGVLLAAFAWLLWLIANFAIPEKEGWQVASFENFTGQESSDNLHRLVYRTAQEAAEIFQRSAGQKELLGLEMLDIPLFNALKDYPPEITAAIESLEIDALSLPVGKLFLGLRRWADRRSYTLEGAVYQEGDQCRLSARQVHRSSGRVVQVWHLQTENTEHAPAALARDFAFKILHFRNQGSNEVPRSWRELQRLVEGLLQIELCQGEEFNKDRLYTAANTFSAIAFRDPDNVRAHHLQGVANTMLGNFEQAEQCFKAVQDLEDRAGQHKSRQSLAAHYNHGLVVFYQFDPPLASTAISSFNMVIGELETRPGPSPDLLLALSYCSLANVYAALRGDRQQKKYTENLEKAHVLLNEAGHEENWKPVWAAYHNAKGMYHYRQREFEQSVNAYEKALQAAPTSLGSQIYMETARLEITGQAKQARQALTHLVGLNLPGYSYARYRVGMYYAHAGQCSVAMKILEQAGEEGLARAWYALGRLKVDKRCYSNPADRDLEGALEMFRKATAEDPTFAPAWQSLAWYIIRAGLLDAGQLAEALDAAQNAVRLNPQSWKNLDTRGLVYFHLKQPGESQNDLEDSIAISSEKQNLYHLALVQESQKGFEKALNTVDRSLELKQQPYNNYWHGLCQKLRPRLQEQ
jgi:tetratricopeptide (TPR) repeat protein